jgi:cobalt/nickel transport system permease protein
MNKRQSRPWSLEALDPRLRILTAVVFAILVVGLSSTTTLGIALAGSIGLVLWAHLPLGATLRRLAAIDGLMLVVVVLLPFSVPGTPLITLGPMAASAEGLVRAIDILLTANTVALSLMALIGPIDPARLGHALARLHVPERLVQLLFFTVRYIDVILGESARLRIAMRARGFQLANRLHVYRSIGYLIGMLLIRSLERSERILDAMRCRGFEGRFHQLEELRYRRVDLVAAGVVAILFGGLLMIDLGRRHAL